MTILTLQIIEIIIEINELNDIVRVNLGKIPVENRLNEL
jgi:hypothetical protein